MTLANLINQLLASDKAHECEHNMLECQVVFMPAFGHGLYAENMKAYSASYLKEDDVILVTLINEECDHV